MSEDLRAPRVQAVAENAIRARDRAWRQLLDEIRLRQCGKRDPAEVDRTEHGDLAAEVRRVVGVLRAPAYKPPASLVPRTELVAHLEHDCVVARVRPRGQRSADVDESHPNRVANAVTRMARLREHEE